MVHANQDPVAADGLARVMQQRLPGVEPGLIGPLLQEIVGEEDDPGRPQPAQKPLVVVGQNRRALQADEEVMTERVGAAAR
jgi:hypothetical protein